MISLLCAVLSYLIAGTRAAASTRTKGRDGFIEVDYHAEHVLPTQRGWRQERIASWGVYNG